MTVPRRFSIVLIVLSCVLPAAAQMSGIEGFVKDKEGKPLAGANIVMARMDVNRSYTAKTDKKGYYFYGSLPLGFYSIKVQQDGSELVGVAGVRTQTGSPLLINFDLRVSAREQENMVRQQLKKSGAEWSYLKMMIVGAAPPAAASPAAPAGPAEPPARAMTPEEKAAIEKALSERSAQIKARDDLNQVFSYGLAALQARKYAEAVAAFAKAGESAPQEAAIWANLGAAYSGLATGKSGAEAEVALQKSIEAYGKSLELTPNDPSTHYSYAAVLARGHQVDTMWTEAQKYAALDPANAYRVYFNLGSVLTNSGQTDAAAEAFRRATEAAPNDPNNAEAFYQYAVTLMAKARMGDDGKVIPVAGTTESLRKYLQLAPAGPNSQSAKDLLTSLGSQLDTEVSNSKTAKKKK
jgi:Flp pilus assembly protein TadD